MSRNRLILVAGATGAAAVLAAVLIFVAGKSTSTPPATTAAATPSSSLAGIPQHADTLGQAGAPATLIVYEDPQCPYCRRWNLETLPSVVEQFVRTGRLKIVYRGAVIIGPDSVRGLRAIYAAGRQNKLWNLADALYVRQGPENSGWISDRAIAAAAREVGANGKAILAGMGSAAVDAALVKAQAQARADQLRGTPTFMIERPPALPRQLTVPGLDPASFIPALAAALQ